MGKRTNRSDGRVQVRVATGERNANGTIRYKSFYGKTKKEAIAKAEEYKLDMAIHGNELNKTTYTLSEWVYHYLFNNKKYIVKGSTFERYMCTYNNHVKESDIGRIELKQLKPMHLQKYLNRKKGLSTSSIKKIKGLLEIALTNAVANDLIRKNPMLEVTLPTSEIKPTLIQVLNLDEQKAYVESLRESCMDTLLFTLLYTGMRVGEAIALKWHNVDLNKGIIRVCENLKRVREYEEDGESKYVNQTTSPKTAKGNREIPIPQCLILRLKKFKLKSHKSREDYVFCTRNGTALQYNNIRRAHMNKCKKAKINPYSIQEQEGHFITVYRGVGIHALRHTYATRLVENNVDIKTVSELLGHASIEITLRFYVHSTNDSKKDAATKINAAYCAMLGEMK